MKDKSVKLDLVRGTSSSLASIQRFSEPQKQTYPDVQWGKEKEAKKKKNFKCGLGSPMTLSLAHLPSRLGARWR